MGWLGIERMVLLVAMATPEDMRVNAEHIKLADQFVEIAGGTNNNNYANVQLIVEVRIHKRKKNKKNKIVEGKGDACVQKCMLG